MKYIIDANNLNYRDLNLNIKKLVKDIFFAGQKQKTILLENVLGQRYIGDGIKSNIRIEIKGTPGNDLGAFMDGPQIEVYGNGQDGLGNTMNSGKIIVHGDAGDIVGHSMRGGEIYIKGNIGYRGGIHMKSYMEKIPVIVVGGKAGNFLGEYMAGGIIIVFGLGKNKRNGIGKDKLLSDIFESKAIAGNYIGTGMHGGKIYIGGNVEDYKLGKEVKKEKIDEDDKKILNRYLDNFCSYFEIDKKKVLKSISYNNFVKLIPYTHRPYGKLYAY